MIFHPRSWRTQRKILNGRLTPDRKYITVTSAIKTNYLRNQIWILDFKTFNVINTLKVPSGLINDFIFTREGKFLLVSTTNTIPILYNHITSEVIRLYSLSKKNH